MLLRFSLTIFFTLLLFIGQSKAQCADPSPSGDCDQDGIINGLDSDADNDGILDLNECQDLVEESFDSANGLSVTFTFPSATTGIFIDLYALDNSFKISVNGVDLVNDELQFQSGPSTPADSDMVFASDLTRHGRNGNPNIWNINGGPGDPIVRLKISADGQILILGKRTSNSALEELIVQPGDPPLNNLTWNINTPNTVTINQEVVGPTYINGQIFGLDCTNDSDGDGTPDYLDLNSDNDLCPDAIEGDANLMNGDLLDNTVIDANVDECGIPVVLGPQGQGIGTSTDPNQMSAACLRFEIDTFSPSCIGNDDGYAIVNVFNGSGDFIFELLPNQLIQSANLFDSLAAGNYTLLVSRPSFAFATTLSFTIEPSTIVCLSCATLSSPFDCTSSTSGSINVMPTGGLPQYSYSINGGPMQADGLFENLNEGTYVFEIRDGSGQAVTCVEEVQMIDLPIVEIEAQLCFGDSIQIGNNFYSNSGMFIDTIESLAGCDSIIRSDLRFLDLIEVDQAISLCRGDSLEVGVNNYTIAGNYIDTLQSVSGCDSIVSTELQFFNIPEIDQEIAICEGDSVIVAGSVYFVPGIYIDTLLNSSGCDSLVNTELRFFDMPVTNQEISICQGDSLAVAASIYFFPGTYLDTIPNFNGCDSIINTELQFFDMPVISQEISICEGDSLIVGGSIYFDPGIYRDTLQNLNGCDSLINSELLIINHTELFQSVGLCAGDSLNVGTSTYTISGDYMDILVNARGCDSLIFTTVEFMNEVTFSQEANLCPGESITVGPNLYTTSGVFIDTLQSQSGCDSIVTSIVGSLENSEFFQSMELCSGDSLSVGANYYKVSGIFNDTLQNINGCDSIIETELLILDNIVFSQNIELCVSDSIVVGTSVYQETGNYIDSLISYKGCDSLVNTNLTLLEIEQEIESYKICVGDSIELNMGIFSEPGSYTFLIEEENDCNYELTINIELDDDEICSANNCKTYIPNVFSPDDDGMNDTFQPFSKVVTFEELMIFDRWGNKLYESTDLNPTWDGTFQNKKLLPAVYVYMIKGVCKDGEQVIFVNDITLIR